MRAPGKREAAEELIALAFDEQQRHEHLRRSSFGAKLHAFIRLEVLVRDDERVFDGTTGSIAAQSTEPSQVADGHRDLEGHEIGKCRVGARA